MNNKGNVAVVGYMLGVSDAVMERSYASEYEKIKQIPFLEDLKVIRSFNRIRQNILKNYKVYKDKSLTSIDTTYIDEELMYLKDRGYNLINISKLDSKTESLLNAIKKDVDYLVTSVLVKLKIDYPIELKSLFEFPMFDKKSLLSFVNGFKCTSLPHGIVVPKYRKIQSSVQYLLSTDTTLYASAFSLCDKEYVVEEGMAKWFDWEAIGVKVEDEVNVNSVKESKIEVKNIESVNNNLSINMETTDMPVLKKNLIEETVQVVDSCDTYFVDCDNIDFFKFLSMLDILKEKGIKDKKFYLYTDLKATYLWNIIEDSESSDAFDFVYRKVDRIRGNKSVVDLVIAVDICKEVMQKGKKKVGLISSDSDFYGVITNIDCDFVVGYSSECTSSGYLHYLSKHDYSKFDVSVFEKEETLTNVLDKVITYMALSVLSNISISNWDIDILTESIRNGIERESSFTVSDELLVEKVNSILSELKISLKESVLYFGYEDISIKIKK